MDQRPCGDHFCIKQSPPAEDAGQVTKVRGCPVHHGGDAEATGQGLCGGFLRSHRIPDTEKFGVESNTKYDQPCLRSILSPVLYTCMEQSNLSERLDDAALAKIPSQLLSGPLVLFGCCGGGCPDTLSGKRHAMDVLAPARSDGPGTA